MLTWIRMQSKKAPHNIFILGNRKAVITSNYRKPVEEQICNPLQVHGQSAKLAILFNGESLPARAVD
jgi:hypothetical protein